MERLVREELERWDSESSIGGSGRGTSPATSSTGRTKSKSRPSSSIGGAAGGVRHFECSSQVLQQTKQGSTELIVNTWPFSFNMHLARGLCNFL